MEREIDDLYFTRAEELAERVKEWQTNPLLSIGPDIYLEDGGSGGIITRAVLIEKTLSDGSTVYNIRLS